MATGGLLAKTEHIREACGLAHRLPVPTLLSQANERLKLELQGGFLQQANQIITALQAGATPSIPSTASLAKAYATAVDASPQAALPRRTNAPQPAPERAAYAPAAEAARQPAGPRVVVGGPGAGRVVAGAPEAVKKDPSTGTVGDQYWDCASCFTKNWAKKVTCRKCRQDRPRTVYFKQAELGMPGVREPPAQRWQAPAAAGIREPPPQRWQAQAAAANVAIAAEAATAARVAAAQAAAGLAARTQVKMRPKMNCTCPLPIARWLWPRARTQVQM